MLSKEEKEEVIASIGGPDFVKVIQSHLSKEVLKTAFEQALAGDFEPDTKRKVLEEVFVNFARKVGVPADILEIGEAFGEGEFKEAYVQGITKNARTTLKPLLLEGTPELSQLAALSDDKKFIEKCVYEPDEYGTYGDTISLWDKLSFMGQLENGSMGFGSFKPSHTPKNIWETADDHYFQQKYVPEGFTEQLDAGPLDYTQAEKFAIKVYEGVAPGMGALSGSNTSYMMMNAMMFPGIDNELERLFDDQRSLSPSALYAADELMDTSLDLYSVMYKYGQRMTEDRVGYRVDRASSAKAVYEGGEIISNFSTSTAGYQGFSKKDIALVRAVIKKGTPCADFKEILGEADYQLSNEAEILIAPHALVSSKAPRKPITDDEKSMTNYMGEPASAVYEMEISGPEKAKELTPEEEKDLAEKTSIYMDEGRRDKAARFLTKLGYLKNYGYSKEDVLVAIDPQEMQEYIEWKQAFQTAFRYRARQRMLQIDRDVDRAKQEGKKLFTEPEHVSTKRGLKSISELGILQPKESKLKPEKSDKSEEYDFGFEIPMKEIDGLAQERDYKKHTTFTKKIVSFIKSVIDKDKSKPKGKEIIDKSNIGDIDDIKDY